MSHSNSLSELQKSQVKSLEEKQKQAEQALQELRALLDTGRQQQEEAVKRKEKELRQAMDIPQKYWPPPEMSLREVLENVKKQINLMEKTLSHGQNLPDRKLVRWASGGLALQGIYKTSSHRDWLEQREELLSVPEEFWLFEPEQVTQMESKEFTSSQAESIFSQTIRKLGFSISTVAKGNGWGINLEGKEDQGHSKHSESMENKQLSSEHSYFCSTKFMYVPLVSCHFHIDQLQLSKEALQELKCIDNLLDHSRGADRNLIVRDRTEKFFQRFGSHANQGPLHLGGIYWWKAISQGFQSEQVMKVKQQTVEMLDAYIRGSYSGIGMIDAAGMDMSSSNSKTASQNTPSRVQLSMVQTGGTVEGNSLIQWKAGLVASNQTWCVIDRGLQLVPIWNIILSNHSKDFKDCFQLAHCLVENYKHLTGLTALVQVGEKLLSAPKEARDFLETVKSWEVSDPEKQFKQLMDFMQLLCEREKGYDSWISICLTDLSLQNFLANIFDFCKTSSIYNNKFIKSQLHSLLYPHIYSVKNFPQKDSILKWISESKSVPENINITKFSELMTMIKEAQNHLMEVKVISQPSEVVKEARREATYKVSLSLQSFLNYLQETQQPDTQVLLLSIAARVGYEVTTNTFKYLLGCDELNFLLHKMQTAHEKQQELQNISRCRAQAFLLLTGLTAAVGDTVVSPEEKMQHLELIKQHMEQSLTTEIVHVLTKYGACHKWENLENDLELLINDNCIDTNFSLHVDEVKKEFKSLNNESKTLEAPRKPSDSLPCHRVNHKLWDNYKSQVQESGPFLELLQRLGLKERFPKRMTKDDFHLICKISLQNNKPRNEKELPLYFLQMLLMLDYGVRYLVIKDDENTENKVSSSSFNQDNEVFDPFEDKIEGNENTTSVTILRPHIHPMDIQMAILHCADDFARQYLLGKLSICQFALPLLVPHPCNSQIEFYLWSLGQVRRSWQKTDKSTHENNNFSNQLMCQVHAPIVSFIRVGNGLSASKSQIMNCLLSQRKHDIFFHRHCKGSSKDCLLMGGVVEICWFCPAGEEEDRFDSCVSFANLHGNAKEYQQQLTFLQEVSSVLVILLSASEDNKENRDCVRHLCQSSKPFILLFDDKENGMANTSSSKVKIGIRNRNEAELKEELTTTIKKLLKLSESNTYSLEDCAHIAREHGFLVDEDQRECKEAKESAETIMALLQEMDLSQIKEKLLPLQGQLWHQWCQKDKELYHLKEKGNQSIEKHKSEIETEKQKLRQEQLKRAFPLNDLMRSFLQILQAHSQIYTKLFLQWLTVLLDNLTSEKLEKLNKDKMASWSLIQAANQRSQKNSDLKILQSKIESISKEINNYSLGIDHLLREAGQMYETLQEMSPDEEMKNIFLSLPQIAADLMISGFAIELMDGDASYVPLKWVTAILDKISEKLGDKKLFVLSILGLQSSGKSTLLNALFGLQFNVSAGRCTRGAYMQLLKVEETFAEELGFDFFLIVDTEGLRAPELSNKSQNHDNELATFVIGLANLTLINIFGENPTEMQDILQIVIQAFLRMKQVKISPSCLFVHQNVGELTAKVLTMEGRRQLVQRLDEMTVAAAEQEQYSNITCFCDVIKFDVNTQVHYFAHLWDGNPPMAPPNPRYSHNVQELKRQILQTTKKQNRESIMKISDVKMRVQDLWRALLGENFIFSFRNTQEVLAMSKLEDTYNRWTWDLRSHILNLQDQFINQIQNRQMQTLDITKLVTPVTIKYGSIMLELEQYFNEDPDRDILIQWKNNFENKIRILKDALISETQTKVNEMINFKKSQEMLDNKKSDYEKEVIKRSQELALTLKGREFSNEELQQKFDQLWGTWVYDATSNYHPGQEPDIYMDSKNILFHHFYYVYHIWDTINKKYWKNFQIDYDNHIKLKSKWFFNRTIDVEEQISINNTTDRIISKVNEIIDYYIKQRHDYSPNYFHKILHIMEDEVKHTSSKETYCFTNTYKLDLCLSLFKDASEKFKVMHRAFKKANDPVYYLESKKDEFFISFKMCCQGSSSVKTFVDFLWHKLTPAVTNTIQRKIVPKMAGDMRATCPEFNGNRSNLEKHILLSLAEEENFDNYWQYIHKPQLFFKSYIETHVKKYYSGEGSDRINSFLTITLGDMKNTILSAIRSSTNKAKDMNGTVSAAAWLDLFCDYLGSDLIFPRKDLITIEHQEIKDTDFLEEAMSGGLDPAMNTVKEKCLSVSIEEIIPEVTKILSEHLCGCWEQCPFCKAICTNTIPDHDGDHSVPFHRPGAIKGRKWHKTNHISITFCTSAVASDLLFYLSDEIKFPFKTYRQAGGVYATWSITPDSSIQPYWKWFVCRFRLQLEEAYKLKFEGNGEIPDTWYRITKKNVLDDLRK